MLNSVLSRRDSRLAACLLVLASIVSPTAFSASGPDVTVFTLSDTGNHGVAGGIRGYSVGTVSCNIGTVPLNWCDENGSSGCGAGTTDEDHPVIAQNMYRLKNGRFDQIGASWLKHGFLSTNSQNSTCASLAGVASCQSPPLGGSQLGIGCTDPYGSGLNGSRPLGRRSEVNPTSGDFPYPHSGSGSTAQAWNQRVAVQQTDLDAASNAGARYFVEGHYIAPDDAAAGNGLNNASWREVTVSQTNFNLSFPNGITNRQQAAIQAWVAIDPTVEIMNVDIAGTTPVQRFHVARKVTDLGGGNYHYEYAVHNMNSERGADRFEIRVFSSGATITNPGFHDVDAHSGEPYDTADWVPVVNGNVISWEAPAFPSAPTNANFIRWGTMYNFWFDSNKGPAEIENHTLEFAGSGATASGSFWSNIESATFMDSFETSTRRRVD